MWRRRRGLRGLCVKRISNPPGGPAELLLAVGLDGVGGLADGELLGLEDRAPASFVQEDRGPDVLRLGLGVDPADVLYGRAAEQHVGADAERRVELVAPWLDEPVENHLDEPRAPGDDVVEVAVNLRRLHEGHVRVLHERKRLIKEVGFGHEVCIEDDEELGLGHRQGVVDVAGLGPGAAEAAHVAAAEGLGQVPNLIRVPVVQDPGGVEAAHCHGGLDRGPDDVQ